MKKRPDLFGDPARLLRTRGFVGTAPARQQFRAAKQAARRELMLKRMTPTQREAALKQESAFKASQVKEVKPTNRREKMLDAMTPEQREVALKKESEFKAYEAAKSEAKARAKTRRTVAVVGDKAKREAFRAAKRSVRRDDMLDAMTPEQREAALKQEADFKASEAAREQQEAQAKEERTVARVVDRAESPKLQAPRGTSTAMRVPGLLNSRTRLNTAMNELNAAVALLS